MTRERQIALPVIIQAAREHLDECKRDGRFPRQLEQALEAFK